MEIRHENLECVKSKASTTCLDCYRKLGDRAVDDVRHAGRHDVRPMHHLDEKTIIRQGNRVEVTTVSDKQSYADWERTKEPPDDKDFDWDAYMNAEEDHPWE